jgi:hypothetical protein
MAAINTSQLGESVCIIFTHHKAQTWLHPTYISPRNWRNIWEDISSPTTKSNNGEDVFRQQDTQFYHDGLMKLTER